MTQMRYRVRRTLAAASVLGWMVCATPAFGNNLVIWSSPDNGSCSIQVGAPMVYSVYVIMTSSGARRVRFSVPGPSCLIGTVLPPTSPYPAVIGPEQRFDIDFGTCLADPGVVASVSFVSFAPANNCCYPILPDPYAESGRVEVTDCSGNLVLVGSTEGAVMNDGGGLGGPPIVYGRAPADGSISQPVDTKLSWGLSRCSCGLGVWHNHLYFGTDPDPPLVSLYAGYEYDPGPLAPNTTYYWKVVADDSDGGATETPVWEFTTESTVPTEQETWGRIKALFGESADQ